MTLYFAYGSNMDSTQMRTRCPRSKMVAIALLPDHTLAFTHFSARRSCGVADVLPTPNGEVWGCVYEVTEADLKCLDRNEGFQPHRVLNAYDRITAVVQEGGDPAKPMYVQLYVVQSKSPHTIAPNRAYKELLIDGARASKLPDGYIQKLERIEVC